METISAPFPTYALFFNIFFLWFLRFEFFFGGGFFIWGWRVGGNDAKDHGLAPIVQKIKLKIKENF
jgi:hypothetical protein